MVKKYKMLNYGKKYKQMFIDLMQDTTTSIRIPDEITWIGKDRWAYDTNLTYIDFNRVEIVPNETCRDCTNLTQVIFSTHTTQIGDYAFYNCRKFEDTELPHTLTNIGEYTFYNAGSSYSQGTHTFTMIDDVGIHTTIGSSAFSSSHLSEIDAYTNDIGSSAFSSCSSLLNVNLEIHGRVNSYTFQQCNNIENFTISPNSVITSLGYSVFSGLAANKPTAVIAPFDFRNSTFSTIYDGVWNNCIFNGTVYLPSTVSNIQGGFLNNARGNWVFYFLSVPSVSSSSYLRNDSSNFTVRYFFPYTLLGDAATATNWSSHISQMIGYGSGFEAGTTLPQYNLNNGHEYSWYEDAGLTIPISTSQGSDIIYYCTMSNNAVVSYISNITGIDCTVTLNGSDGIVYSINNPYVPLTTTLTINSVATDPTKPYLYRVYVNGQNLGSTEPITYTGAGKPLIIGVSYYDGVTPPGLSWNIHTMNAEFSSDGTSSSGRGLVYNDKLYWSTGWNFGSIGLHRGRKIYDPATDTVTNAASFESTSDKGEGWISVSSYIAFVNNNYLEYLMSYGNYSVPSYQKYDPSTDTMVATTSPAMGITAAGNTITNGNYIYCVHGDGYHDSVGTLYRIDKTVFPYVKENLGQVYGSAISDVINNKIYIFGGIGATSDPGSGRSSNKIQCFDLTTNTLSDCYATLPALYHGGTFAIITLDNKVYIFGGYTTTGLTNAILEYDPNFDTITTLSATLPVAAWGHQCGIINGAIYLMGGQTGTGYSTNTKSDPHIYKFSH